MNLEIRYLNKSYSLINKETFTSISNKETFTTNPTRILNDLINIFSLTRDESKKILINWLKSRYNVNDSEINHLIPNKELIINDEIILFITSIDIEELFRGVEHDFKSSIPRATRVELLFKSKDTPIELLYDIERKIGVKHFNSKLIDNLTNIEYLLFGCLLSNIEYGDVEYDTDTEFKIKLVCNNYIKNG